MQKKTQTSLFAHTHASPHRKSDPRVRFGKPPWVPDPRVVTRQKSVPAIERPRQGPCLVADVTTHLAHARRCLSPFLPPPLAPSPPRRSSPRLPPRFVSFRFVSCFFGVGRRRSSLAGTADRRDGAGARRRRLGLLATASESRRRDVPGGWTDDWTRGATRGWIKNSSARRARRRCVASFGARDARVVMMDGWAHPSVRLGADTTMERHRRLTLRELAR